jgi:hypothetical protein
MGVATWTVSWGRAGPPAILLPTGFTLGDGGIAKPSRGVRAPPGRPPRAGRSGIGEDDIIGMGVVDVVVIGGVPTASREAVVALSRARG